MIHNSITYKGHWIPIAIGRKSRCEGCDETAEDCTCEDRNGDEGSTFDAQDIVDSIMDGDYGD